MSGWVADRERIAEIRAALRTASTEDLHTAVRMLLEGIETDIDRVEEVDARPGSYRWDVVSGETLCVAILAGALRHVTQPVTL